MNYIVPKNIKNATRNLIIIQTSTNPSISNMSFSTADCSSAIPIRRKRTATERLMENGDPLIANKKAREAAKKKVSFSSH